MSRHFICSVAFILVFTARMSMAGSAVPGFTFVSASTASLDNPHDLKLSPDGKSLFVADVGNNRVAILNSDSLALISEFGADHQSGTHDVDFDQQGRVYVADTHNSRVTVYETNTADDAIKSTLIGELSERIRGPEGVLVHPNNTEHF